MGFNLIVLHEEAIKPLKPNTTWYKIFYIDHDSARKSHSRGAKIVQKP